MDHHRAGPQFFRAGPCMRDRRGAIHAGCLRGVEIELVAVHDANTVKPPLRFG
jgi:hypothetical protein